jgi:hypothetical protein
MRFFSSSLSLIIALSCPAFMAIGGYIFYFDAKEMLIPRWFSIIGLVLLIISTFTGIIISIWHEMRSKKTLEQKKTECCES